MKSPQQVDARTVALWIEELEDGVITPENRAHLMHLMRAHESVRNLYIKHIELTALIHQAAVSRIELGTMPVSIETLRHEKRKSAILSLSYAAAAMLVLGLGLLFWRVGLDFRSPSPWIALESSDEAAYAVVRGEQDAQAAGRLMPGDQITLKRGLLQFRFPSGVEAIIEGGSQLELISESTVRMDGGMGWFRVPENARGFTVRTKLGRVVDLGTEFGIRFDGRNDLEVHVAKGLVKVAPALPGTEEVELTEGKAMRFDAEGKGETLQLKSSLFRQQFSKQVPHIHWSFNRLTNVGFPARGTLSGIEDFSIRPQRLDGAHFKPADCLAGGMHDKAFSMKGDGLFAESSFPGIEGDAPRTVALWIRHRIGISNSTADPRTGLGATTPFGNQAYLLNYTNAGLTTTQGATGAILTAGVTYTLAFHAATLPGQENAEYRVELVAFEPHEDNEARKIARYGSGVGTVLAISDGLVTTSDMSARGQLTLTPRASDPHLGKELGIRLVKSSGPVLYDHLRLSTRRGSGRETVVFTESFESPVVAGYAEQTQPVKGWIGAAKGPEALSAGYGASQHGLFSHLPVFSTPFIHWSGSGSEPLWTAFLLPTRQPRWSVTDGHRFYDSPLSDPLKRDEWIHVATVHSGKTTDDGQPEIRHYLNGEPVESALFQSRTTGSALLRKNSAATLRIGALPNARPGDPTLDADIDELHIFRATLAKEEIQSLMERNHPVFYRK